MSEAEVARDLHVVLAKVQLGIEVVIEQNYRPVAVIRPSQSAAPGRKRERVHRKRSRTLSEIA